MTPIITSKTIQLENSFTLNENIKADSLIQNLIEITDTENIILEGNGFQLDGNFKAVRLIHIHNCHNLTIQNLTLRNGNTENLKFISRNDLKIRKIGISIFEILDGAGVSITGNSTVLFENCVFENNYSVMCGGAISNQSKGKITIRNCKFIKNSAGHTGSAIDNLISGSDLLVEKCIFQDNQSNIWNIEESPHGQISVFPYSKAEIINSKFSKGSIPFDSKESSKIICIGNEYVGYKDWDESSKLTRSKSFFNKIKLFAKLWWIVPKTIGKVKFVV